MEIPCIQDQQSQIIIIFSCPVDVFTMLLNFISGVNLTSFGISRHIILVNCDCDELSNSEEHRKKKYFHSCSIDLINCKENCHADTHGVMVVGVSDF